jgi:hypothetical protein
MVVDTLPGAQLAPGRAYSWDELGAVFGFKPAYLSVAGGMMSRPDLDALLLVTWPGGARSFDYDDYWSQGDLIYTGRGKTGDQKLEGPNRDLAENRRTNYVFEGSAGSWALRFLGVARSVRYWRARGLGDDGVDREILRYQLRFLSGGAPASQGGDRSAPSTGGTRRSSGSRQKHRQRRPFDPARSPAQYKMPVPRTTPEETAARREKASREHHSLLVRLQTNLAALGWSNLDEIPSAIDLEATKGERKVLFEAKTVTARTELSQTRFGLSQLLEYRFFYGEPTDYLCLVTNQAISDLRIRFLESHAIAVAYEQGDRLVPCGILAHELLADAR